MGTRSLKRDRVVNDAIDQDPAGADVTVTVSLPFARQLVIAMAFAKGLPAIRDSITVLTSIMSYPRFLHLL